MSIDIMDPVALTGAAVAYGSVVPGSYKRKYTKMTVFNGTAGAVTLKVYLVPVAGAAAALTQYIDYDLAINETYNCPECIGAGLLAGGQLYASGNGLSLSAVATDTLNG